jgi:hypothetical protein
VAEAPVETDRKLTSRERRIQEQRAKIETLRAAQQRTRIMWGAGIVAVLGVIAFLAFTFITPPVPAQGRQATDEGATHVADGTPLSYRSRPPSSGNHYAQWAGYQFYDRELSPGNWVHNLEHGAIVLLYNPDKCAADCLTALRDTYTSLPPSKFRTVKALVTPYRDMDKAIAVVAWTWIDEMDVVDKARITAFYRAHVDRGPEDVP